MLARGAAPLQPPPAVPWLEQDASACGWLVLLAHVASALLQVAPFMTYQHGYRFHDRERRRRGRFFCGCLLSPLSL